MQTALRALRAAAQRESDAVELERFDGDADGRAGARVRAHKSG